MQVAYAPLSLLI